jgi:cell division protein FtsQ
LRLGNRKKGISKRHRSAYWRGEKLVIFLKRGVIVLLLLIVIMGVIVGLSKAVRPFLFNNLVVYGNYHLEESEIKDAVYITSGENLFNLSFEELRARVKRIAWIKDVTIRKQFPHTIMLYVEEATPRAVLRFKNHQFLVDSEGEILEELGRDAMSFLPVIVGINPSKDKGGILESLRLIDALEEEKMLDKREAVEITLKPFGLVVYMDGESIRLGYGNYRDKLKRWKELEPEIKKRDVPIEYVDLRFKDKVIIRPVKRAEKG